jgi:uncharacterized membrane protein
MEEFLKNITHHIAWATEFAAACIIAIGSIRAFGAYFRHVFQKDENRAMPNRHIRLSLGRTLILALEFLLAADILQTAVAPTWDDIGKLAAIATLRTALNYFLERELAEMEDRPQE